jgi:riboflavin kinase/FMN adenylyltransferase
VDGHGIGTELGYPTANVDPHNEVHPPAGIYAGYALMDGRKYKAAIYIGSRPTFQNDDAFVVEVHLMDVKLDIYGRELEVFLVQKMREDKRFPSRDELRIQIGKDIASIRELLTERFQRNAGQY